MQELRTTMRNFTAAGIQLEILMTVPNSKSSVKLSVCFEVFLNRDIPRCSYLLRLYCVGDGRMNMKHWFNYMDKENRSLRRKICSSAT